jgi:hypothetical protein
MEFVILTIIFVVCVFLAMRYVVQKLDPSGSSGNCHGCDTADECGKTDQGLDGADPDGSRNTESRA